MLNKFDKIPERAAAELLSTRELALLVNSSRKNRGLFQPLLKERELLHHVVRGDLTQVSALLAQSFQFLSTKTTVTSLPGKTFTRISAADYILWALDKDQFNAMLSCLPQTAQGIQVEAQLRAQYNDPAHQLLLHAVRGEHDAVRALLTQDISLLSKKSSVIDLSGRVFEGISPFEYALWALDSHMWNTMLKCVSENEQGDEVLKQLGVHYKTLQTEGVTYRLNGTLITESHFNFQQTIIKELQTQVDLQNAPGNKDWAAIDKQWREGVGGAQRLLPMHVVNEYCTENRPFTPIPDFTIYPGPSTQFYNWLTGQDENWFKAGSSCGIDFAIYKGGEVYVPGAAGVRRARGAGGAVARPDLDAMMALCKVRTNDFINLATLLGVAPDSQPLAFHV